jgi:AraC-like DNA-binding protein/mannose-6-phosphate isomerase-like protein (cupin superfamily)
MTSRRTLECALLRHYGASPGSHSHDHFQILWGLSGALDPEVDGRSVRVAPGSGCVIAPGDRHDFQSSRGSVYQLLDSENPGWPQCSSRQRTSAPPADALRLAQYLASALRHGRPFDQTLGPALLREAWLSGTAPPSPRGSGARRRFFDWTALQQWVTHHWHDKLTVGELAERVHLSPSQFAARCREDHGMGAMSWLRSHRLAHAVSLRDTGMAVAEVARRTGYRSPPALTAAMRRLQHQ